MSEKSTTESELSARDFMPDEAIRWCPGCGDYAILSQVQKLLARTGSRPENTVFVSGIGCSSRFPYYMNTYGFHSIHGRAAPLATGLKLARPELDVWVVTGDGDGLAIGGNHMLHVLRRNIDINILLFNNRIYALTKGQFSPTSELGKRTKTSPMGTVERPVRPTSVALGAEATFVARALSSDAPGLAHILERAASHRGTCFIEIYQDCAIFNAEAFAFARDKDVRADSVVMLEHGKPLVFGRNRDKAIAMAGLRPKVVNFADAKPGELLIHDEQDESPLAAFMLSQLQPPDFPEPFGIFRCVQRPCLDQAVHDQIRQAVADNGQGDVDELFAGDKHWRIE